MSESIEAYCRNCKETRTFYLVQEDPLRTTYSCNYCSLRKNKMTLLGGALAAGTAIGILFGISHGGHHPDGGGGYS